MAAGDTTACSTPISAVVLAGGQGRRLAGADKGLQHYDGKPLIEWVLARLQGQCAEILISANRNLDAYRRYGFTVITDRRPGFLGPLAGIASALTLADNPLLAVVPCDSPLFPDDLITRLLSRLGDADSVSVVTPLRSHPVFCLLRRQACLASLEAYLDRGETRLSQWLLQLRHHEALFPDERPFTNLNTAADFEIVSHDSRLG